MLIRFTFVLALASAILMISSEGVAQQEYNAFATGGQALPANSSTRSVLVDVSVRPAGANPSNFTLTFLGRGGTPFPSGSTATINKGATYGQSGVLVQNIGFAPDANWIFAFDVTPADLALLRQNRWYFQVATPDFPNGEVRGQFKLANGTYNDYDGDGRTDIQVYRSSNNTFYALQSSNGAYREQQVGAPGDSVSLTVDFDGDARSDFSTARYNAEVLWRIFSSRTNTLRETRWGSSTLGDFFASADYDGDGATDIAVFRAGVWYIIDSATGNFRYEYWGTSGDVPAANDYDGDGKADLTIARSEGGQRVWYTRFSANAQTRVLTWGISSDAFFTGRTDFDADGKADLLVIRNVSGQRNFYILRSSDSQLQILQWGLSSDVVKLGDYDGDGKTDPAVTRAVSGQRVFYILQSSNGGPRYETFGLAGDF